MIEWRSVGVVKGVDFTGYYEVSNDGLVKSLRRVNCVGAKVNERILKPASDKDGYLVVVLSKDNTKRTMRVHILVAMAFIENPNNLPVVNHKNEIKNDNRVENLEWCTIQYNSTYGTVQERIAEVKHYTMGTPVAQMDLSGNILKIWRAPYFAKAYGYNKVSISACIHGRIKSYKGCLWKYVSLEEYNEYVQRCIPDDAQQ